MTAATKHFMKIALLYEQMVPEYRTSCFIWPLQGVFPSVVELILSRNERDLFATSKIRWSLTYNRTICNCQEITPTFLLGCLVMLVDFSKSSHYCRNLNRGGQKDLTEAVSLKDHG